MKLQLIIAIAWAATYGCAPSIEKRFFPKPTESEMGREVTRLGQTDVSPTNLQPASQGSLWPADDHVFFYADKKALRVGDSITVRIVENAAASNTARETIAVPRAAGERRLIQPRLSQRR